jgi:hypothetical protein
MHLPRWLVVVLIFVSVLVPVSAVVGWLVAPHFTMKRFVASVAAGDYDEASKMTTNGRWKKEAEYVVFESGEVKASFPADYWPRAVSETNLERYTNSIFGWLSGERHFGAKENVFLVTFRFNAYIRKVSFSELYLYQDDKRIYKEFSLYGFSANVSATRPLTVEGNYSFGDPDGGYLVLLVDGKERDRVPVCLGNSKLKLTCRNALAGSVSYRVEVTDKEGNLRNKIERSIDL